MACWIDLSAVCPELLIASVACVPVASRYVIASERDLFVAALCAPSELLSESAIAFALSGIASISDFIAPPRFAAASLSAPCSSCAAVRVWSRASLTLAWGAAVVDSARAVADTVSSPIASLQAARVRQRHAKRQARFHADPRVWRLSCPGSFWRARFPQRGHAPSQEIRPPSTRSRKRERCLSEYRCYKVQHPRRRDHRRPRHSPPPKLPSRRDNRARIHVQCPVPDAYVDVSGDHNI